MYRSAPQGSPNIPNWQRSYFGTNTARLAQVKARYDPLRLFTKPLVVDGVDVIRDMADLVDRAWL